jgi:Mrp family chromosome partitioning ATPase
MTYTTLNAPELGRSGLEWLRRWFRSRPADLGHAAATKIDPASHEIDALFQTTFGEGARVVGLIGVEAGDGVTTLAAALARRCALTHMRAILVDVSGAHDREHGTAHKRISEDGYEILTIHPNTGELYRLRTQEFLRKLFSQTLGDYDAVIVKCAPAIARPNDTVPGYITAACLDTSILACMGGRTTRIAVDQARRVLADVPLRGLIINGRDQPTLGEELAREAMRLHQIAPSFAQNLAVRARRSRLLDVRT